MPERILIMGGSFDPPHKGHKALLLGAANTLKPEQVLLIPAFQAPLKGIPGAPAGQRVEMLRAMVSVLPKGLRKLCSVSLSEVRSKRKVYTVETLRGLKRRFPKDELHFVVGSDSAESFHLWRDPEALKRLSSWWVGPRPGSGTRLPSRFHKLPGRFPDISSTDIRLAIATGGRWKKLVPKPVAALIRRKRLYGLALLRTLEDTLKDSRFHHTLAVADIAVRLAERHGLDRQKAALAGLLHDCAKCMSPEEMVSRARAWRIKAPRLADIIRRQPKLLHSYLSAEMARRRFGISDLEVLSAVRKHTLGALSMSPLDKLIYVADSVSEDRGHPLVRGLRTIAFRDLDEALTACLESKVSFARSRKSWLHPVSLSLWKKIRA
ncbi:MAG: bis(5'-nucleosyl)-tetraphosphatase (symmetrical) YqeK [Elusimicrobia bacterium]|nr:bis(5'-nucleosyl)-tetraphosphatase (symmetrical) YqeK [Elusimicrobiota bacterium]